MLLFKKKFLEAIRNGEKTQTIRLWLRPRMKAGQRSYIPGVGYIRIGSVEQVELEDLTDGDARPDGFPTANELRAEIVAIYSQYPDQGQKAYRIRFALAPDEKKRLPGPRITSARCSLSVPAGSTTEGLLASRKRRGTNKSGSGKLMPSSRTQPGARTFQCTSPSRGMPSAAFLPRLVLPADGFALAQSRKKSIKP